MTERRNNNVSGLSKWGRREIDRVRELLAAGLSHSEIAAVMGMSRSVVGGIVHRNASKNSLQQRTDFMRNAACRAGRATQVSLWLNDPNRPKPSLARVKWLERPDP